jgi:hypothetical protein
MNTADRLIVTLLVVLVVIDGTRFYFQYTGKMRG